MAFTFVFGKFEAMRMTQLIPEWAKKPLREARARRKRAQFVGTARYCPVCQTSSNRFVEAGAVEKRPDAQCVHCGSVERHRLLWWFLEKKTDLFDGRKKTMLHVAPESFLETKFQKLLGSSYLTADLFNPRAMVKMDITDIQYPDESFDVIYCSHVLEHVPDDRRAMREFSRTLKKHGWAILLVPIDAEKTIEDPSVTDPKERERLFGQDDHVRKYGPDYVDRLREAGFKVEITKASDLVTREELTRMGLIPAESIFFCMKD